MINIYEKTKCSGCYACAEICSQSCVDMISDAEGFWYPKVDETQCVNCGLCEKVCPIITSHAPLQEEPIAAYAAMHKDEAIRLKSSSGGAFSVLSTYVLENGGVVFGAAFDERFNVVHKHIEDVDKLDVLRGSKYVQSRIGSAYREAEDFLKAGRLVLFSGTPCQIEGLISYLKKPYDNLITQDLICHGVPSPMVWQKYIEYRKASANGLPLKHASFRSKNSGWKGFSMLLLFENGQKYQEIQYKDPMMQVFLKNLCLRPSCYDCHFKNKVRKSDITLADFWGVQNILPDMDDNKGTSLIIIQSQKGEEIFEKVRESMVVVEVESNTAISYNSAMTRSVDIPQKRNTFLQKVSEKNFLEIQKKYCKPTLKSRIKARIVGFIKKCLKNT